MSEANLQVAALQQELSDMNLSPCRPVQEAAASAESTLRDRGLDGWVVLVVPGAGNGDCGKASVESAWRTISVGAGPRRIRTVGWLPADRRRT